MSGLTFRKLKYSEAVSMQPRSINPFDLILFDGDDPDSEKRDKISGLIKQLSKLQTGDGQFSHIGIVVSRDVLPNVPQLTPGKFYCFESTFSHNIKIFGREFVSGPVDSVEGRGFFGIQVRDLETLVRKYNGKVYRGRLLKNPWIFREGETLEECTRRRNLIIQRFSRFFEDKHFNSYNLNPLDLIGTVFSPARPIRNKVNCAVSKIEGFLDVKKEGFSSWSICSQFVVDALICIGVLEKKTNSKNALPVDVTGVDVDEIPQIISSSIVQLLPDKK